MVIYKKLLTFYISRIIITLITITTAFSITFMLLKFMPIDIVENIITMYINNPAMQGFQDPKVIEEMRRALYDLFGLQKDIFSQYVDFMKRIFTFDFGVSIIAFPSSVGTLIAVALPWTVALLTTTTIISWTTGNILGVLVTMLELKREHGILVKTIQGIALTLAPMPYHILALILIFLFTYLVPIFPIPGSGGGLAPILSWEWFITALRVLALPALSLMIIGILGYWFMSARTLSLNITKEDFYHYALVRGISMNRIVTAYLMRNILAPQVTGLGLSMGLIFSGALMVESIFGLPGLGSLIYRAVINGDIVTSLGVLSLSIYGVSIATLILDLIYPLLDPRVMYR